MTEPKIAIVGGGPGGLFAAFHLHRVLPSASVHLYEASDRLGGKVCTERLGRSEALYEAGTAELYDYSCQTDDPLRALVSELGLSTVSMRGDVVCVGNTRIADPKALDGAMHSEWSAFWAQCLAYYQDGNGQARHQPLANSFGAFLDSQIRNPFLKRYIEATVRSDCATELYRTSVINGIDTLLMDDPQLCRLYTVSGGLSNLILSLTSTIKATVFLRSPVGRIVRDKAGEYRLTTQKGACGTYGSVLLAVPCSALAWLQFSDNLHGFQRSFVRTYDAPAHYLRVAILFQRRFWEDFFCGDFIRSDALGGVCIYDETLRYPCSGDTGILNWLLSGSSALILNNLPDREITEYVLDTLPADLRQHKQLALESRVHRWMGAVSASPGSHGPLENACRLAPGAYLVGDYLLDSTLNGAYEAAEQAVKCLREDLGA
jgi:monoamine oxidase